MEGVGDGSKAAFGLELLEDFTAGSAGLGSWGGCCQGLPDGWDQ